MDLFWDVVVQICNPLARFQKSLLPDNLHLNRLPKVLRVRHAYATSKAHWHVEPMMKLGGNTILHKVSYFYPFPPTITESTASTTAATLAQRLLIPKPLRPPSPLPSPVSRATTTTPTPTTTTSDVVHIFKADAFFEQHQHPHMTPRQASKMCWRLLSLPLANWSASLPSSSFSFLASFSSSSSSTLHSSLAFVPSSLLWLSSNSCASFRFVLCISSPYVDVLFTRGSRRPVHCRCAPVVSDLSFSSHSRS